MISRVGYGLTLWFFCVSPFPVKAEYRVALLIDNSQHQNDALKSLAPNLKALADSLEKRQGFHCEIVKNLDAKALKQTIESFAKSTPVRSTALVFFAGPVSPASSGGQASATLLGIGSKNGGGYALDSVFEDLRTQGGSQTNLVVVDCPTPIAHELTIPKECFLAFTDAKTLETNADLIAKIKTDGKQVQSTLGKNFSLERQGSRAVASPDKFAPGKQAGDEWVNRRGMVFCWCPSGR